MISQKLLLLLGLLALSSAVSITNKLNLDEDFNEEKLTGFFTSKNKPVSELIQGKVQGNYVFGMLEKDEIVTYRESFIVPPRRILSGSMLIFASSKISAKEIKIYFGKSLATIDRIEDHYTGAQLVVFSSKADKSRMMTIRFNVQSASWSFRNFLIEADICSPYCEDCQDNTATCSACAPNSTFNTILGVCQCNTGYKATNIGPLVCQIQKPTFEYPDLCYLEHVLYLGQNAIRSNINFDAASNSYVFTSVFNGLSMPTSTCFASSTGVKKISAKLCFTKQNAPKVCDSNVQPYWLNDGKTLKFNIPAKELAKYSFTNSGQSTFLSKPRDFYEYSFQYEFGFGSLSQANYVCENCPAVYIRRHSVELRIVQFIDLNIPPLKFVTEAIKTSENCNCPFNEIITGKAVWFKEAKCVTEQKEVIPNFKLSEDMHLAVIMNKAEMKGRITVKSLSATCFEKPVAYSVVAQYNGERNVKVCSTSRANIANIPAGSSCKNCPFLLNIEIAYSQSEVIIDTYGDEAGDDEFFTNFRLLAEEEQSADIINIPVTISADISI